MVRMVDELAGGIKASTSYASHFQAFDLPSAKHGQAIRTDKNWRYHVFLPIFEALISGNIPTKYGPKKTTLPYLHLYHLLDLLALLAHLAQMQDENDEEDDKDQDASGMSIPKATCHRWG